MEEKQQFIEKYEAMEDYIKAKKQVTMGTSNIEHATDKELKQIPLNEAVDYQMQKYSENLQPIIEQIEKQYFDQFEFFLKNSVNVLVYGFGSKYDLLEQFSKEKLLDLPVITINGFSKYISIRHLLESLYQLLIGSSKQFKQKQAGKTCYQNNLLWGRFGKTKEI